MAPWTGASSAVEAAVATIDLTGAGGEKGEGQEASEGSEQERVAGIEQERTSGKQPRMGKKRLGATAFVPEESAGAGSKRRRGHSVGGGGAAAGRSVEPGVAKEGRKGG